MYAITGITGKVGGALARTLLAAGQPVRAVVRDGGKAGAWAEQGMRVCAGGDGGCGRLAAAFGAQATETNLLTQRTLMEQALNALTLPVTFLRPAWFMENFGWDVVSARDQAAYNTGSLYSPA